MSKQQVQLKEKCQSCAYCRTENLTPIDPESKPIYRIDYRYRCGLTLCIVDKNHKCDKFEFPF